MHFSTPADTAAWLQQTATEFMKGPANDLHMPTGPEPAWGTPFIGFAAGDDPLWDSYKDHVGEFHWTPSEAFAIAYPDEKFSASELTVMSWILPQTDATRRDHKKEKVVPSERWARSRIFGENHGNRGLRKHMVDVLRENGVQAVAPHLLEEWQQIDAGKYLFASTWSERHAAYAAGLGTFGLCDGLITPVGKSMRTGSIVMRLNVPITERPYTHHKEYCLFYSSGGICGVCIKRCPAGALSEAGHDKPKCRAYVREVTKPHVRNTWNFDGYGCGFCQVNVPCEKGIPPRPKRKEA
ncbi:4Fe-4S ferredoxin [Desulfovibrio sp. OttesenSCG-928-O18]|nr:4Fe-4S ferredoxin [Desulfovibrio sp. OttesenSCG-928-O18]